MEQCILHAETKKTQQQKKKKKREALSVSVKIR